MVFTAYLKEEYYSKNWEKVREQLEDNSVDDSHYPTVFFYDLDQNRTVWEVFGSHQFIKIDASRKVYLLTNEFWSKIRYEHYNQMKELIYFTIHDGEYDQSKERVYDKV